MAVLDNMQKEILKKIHPWLLQVPKHGHHLHLLDLGHLDLLALAMFNFFLNFFLYMVQ